MNRKCQRRSAGNFCGGTPAANAVMKRRINSPRPEAASTRVEIRFNIGGKPGKGGAHLIGYGRRRRAGFAIPETAYMRLGLFPTHQLPQPFHPIGVSWLGVEQPDDASQVIG